MRKITAIGIKEDGKPYRVIHANVFRADLDSLPKGRYIHTVEKYRKSKSNSQLGYLFAAIYPFVLKGLNDAGWEFTSLEEVDVYCKSLFADKELINRTTGEIIHVPELKRDMSTIEMMTYINSIRDWSLEYLNTYIPEPEEQIILDFDN